MRIRLSKIQLKNFKAFEEISISPNNNFNIIIGENSAGKSTIFEAIHLWEKCYQALIMSSRKGFYKVESSTNRYVNYQELDFLRITNDNDLFFHSGRTKCAEVTLSLTIDGQDFELGFKVSRPKSISNAFFRIQPIHQSQFTLFSQHIVANGKTLDEAIFIYQTRPVAGVLQYENYCNEGQVKKKIQKGLSHEVLRNKIVSKRDSISELESSISKILEKDVKFELPLKSKARTEEYVSLKVSIDSGKKQDLHLQGSGFLQIIEILSTIEFLDAPLKLLLVDEPDSHIHSKLQANLISHLRAIDHNQFFIISHNDQFVTNAGNNEVFFLNAEAKTDKKLLAIDPSSFNIIKESLGGVILSLDKLSQAQHIAFVEGNDDEEYLNALYHKLDSITETKNHISSITFFPLRGKDNITTKIEYNKRTLSSLLKGKTWNTIFDRDFSTNTVDICLKEKIENKGCHAFSHNGYCIESVIFSDLEILKRYITKTIHPTITESTVSNAVDNVISDILQEINNIHSPLRETIEGRFNSQKINRPEFNDLTFNDVHRDWTLDDNFKPQMAMSKVLIKQFVIDLEEKLQFSIMLRRSNDNEEVSSLFFNNYIEFISTMDDVVPSLKDLFVMLGLIELEPIQEDI